MKYALSSKYDAANRSPNKMLYTTSNANNDCAAHSSVTYDVCEPSCISTSTLFSAYAICCKRCIPSTCCLSRTWSVSTSILTEGNSPSVFCRKKDEVCENEKLTTTAFFERIGVDMDNWGEQTCCRIAST